MRHRKSGIKLNRTSSHRQAMFRNMVTSLFKYDRIKTTDAKAKELRRWADHLITLAKRGDLHARRQALAIVREKNVVHKLFEEAQKRFGNISGGYTRIIKIGRRAGDAAPVSIIELVDHDDHTRKKKAKKKVKAAKKEPQASVSQEKESRTEGKKNEDLAVAAEEKSEEGENAEETSGEKLEGQNKKPAEDQAMESDAQADDGSAGDEADEKKASTEQVEPNKDEKEAVTEDQEKKEDEKGEE